MFDFFRREKEYTSCKWLEYGIHFDTWGLYHCCMFSHSEANKYPVSRIKPDLTYDFKDFFKKKTSDRKNQRMGIINKRCTGCFCLENKKWERDNKIRKIAISTNTTCNAKCIYCTSEEKQNYLNKRPDIPILKFIKHLITTKQLAAECEIEFGGGEPTIMKEFEELTQLFLENCNTIIKIHSSGIKYSETIEKALKKDRCELVISVDSGERNLYKKIKRTDSFDTVWKNISKYYKAQNMNKKQVQIKYIIIPEINDSETDIDNFFSKISETEIKKVRVDIETNWYINHKSEKYISEILETVRIFKQKAKALNIECINNASLDSLKNEFKDLYDKITEIN